MTKEEAYRLIKELKYVFDIVRLVDPSRMEICQLNENGQILREPLYCFSVWKKDQRCENCISARVCPGNDRLQKFEFVGDEAYLVTSKYVEVEGIPYALEIVSHTTDNVLFETYGKNEFIRSIERMNRKMYLDALTDAYNRRYYEEQVYYWKKKTAVAMIDVDNFKHVNDHYGHAVGDLVLKEIAATLKQRIRSTDALIRFGGDEFLMVFPDITREAFVMRLEAAKTAVARIFLEKYPCLKLSVSIGGVYSETHTPNLLDLADQLLYEAKELKNTVKIYP